MPLHHWNSTTGRSAADPYLQRQSYCTLFGGSAVMCAAAHFLVAAPPHHPEIIIASTVVTLVTCKMLLTPAVLVKVLKHQDSLEPQPVNGARVLKDGQPAQAA